MAKVLIDTNILIYGFSQESSFYKKTRQLLENVDEIKGIDFYIAEKSLFELVAVLSSKAMLEKFEIQEIKEYLEYLTDGGFTILYSNLQITSTTWRLFFNLPQRKNRIYDLVLAATAIENGIDIIYTKNIKDFESIKEIQIIDPTTD